jgi:hypothetical protein
MHAPDSPEPAFLQGSSRSPARMRWATRAAACCLVLCAGAATAQVPQSTPQSTPPASAQPLKRGNAASAPAPGMGTTPEDRTAPLVTVPLGRTAADPANAPASAGGTDDTMARCKALPPGAARNDCLRKARIVATPR